jgi:hypothetical protein
VRGADRQHAAEHLHSQGSSAYTCMPVLHPTSQVGCLYAEQQFCGPPPPTPPPPSPPGGGRPGPVPQRPRAQPLLRAVLRPRALAHRCCAPQPGPGVGGGVPAGVPTGGGRRRLCVGGRAVWRAGISNWWACGTVMSPWDTACAAVAVLLLAPSAPSPQTAPAGLSVSPDCRCWHHPACYAPWPHPPKLPPPPPPPHTHTRRWRQGGVSWVWRWCPPASSGAPMRCWGGRPWTSPAWPWSRRR